jgi:hypothetical protein
MERWERWHMLPDLEMLRERFVSDWSVRKGKAHHLTDFSGGGNYVIVSDRAKSFIEKNDVGHSRFVPLRVFERPDMVPVEGLWHYWLLTDQFSLATELDDKKKILQTTAGIDYHVGWEVANNPVFCQYISKFPFWCMAGVSGKIAIRNDIFAAMKEAGFTGLVEIASKSDIGRKGHETVGHLI